MSDAARHAEVARILAARARALARRPAQPVAAGELLDLLCFGLADETYAVEARYVQEVHALVHLTPLPGLPAHYPGIVNARGRVLPVLDLKRFFELADTGLADLHRVVHVVDGDLHLGLLSDLGVDTMQVGSALLQRSLPALGGIRADYLMGVSPGGIVVLDVRRIISDPRILVDEEVVA